MLVDSRRHSREGGKHGSGLRGCSYIRCHSREGGKYDRRLRGRSYTLGVIPAKAGIQSFCNTMKRPCVYLLASSRNGTLYVGVTSGLTNRLSLHREDVIGGFTQKYGVH